MMSTERLKNIHKQEQNQRKIVCVMNDLAKTQQDLYEGYIEKEKHEVEQKSDKSIVVTRRNIVRQRVLKKCMESKRGEVERSNAKKIFGRYHGVPVEQIAGQIDTFLEKNHPKIRRRQKIDELFQEGYNKGAILDNNAINDRVNDYFERPLIEIQHTKSSESKEEKNILNSTFPAFSKPFYTGNFQISGNPPLKQTGDNESTTIGTEEKEKLFVKRKVSKFLNEDVPDNVSVQSESPVNYVITRHKGLRPLTLPPIKLGTDQTTEKPMQKRKSKQKNGNCIADLIDRIHKAKDNREKEIKIKKERRAKRLQHERVFGIGGSDWAHAGEDSDVGSSIFSDWDNNPWRKESKRSANTKPGGDKASNEEKSRIESGIKLPSIHVSNLRK